MLWRVWRDRLSKRWNFRNNGMANTIYFVLSLSASCDCGQNGVCRTLGRVVSSFSTQMISDQAWEDSNNTFTDWGMTRFVPRKGQLSTDQNHFSLLCYLRQMILRLFTRAVVSFRMAHNMTSCLITSRWASRAIGEDRYHPMLRPAVMALAVANKLW